MAVETGTEFIRRLRSSIGVSKLVYVLIHGLAAVGTAMVCTLVISTTELPATLASYARTAAWLLAAAWPFIALALLNKFVRVYSPHFVKVLESSSLLQHVLDDDLARTLFEGTDYWKFIWPGKPRTPPSSFAARVRLLLRNIDFCAKKLELDLMPDAAHAIEGAAGAVVVLGMMILFAIVAGIMAAHGDGLSPEAEGPLYLVIPVLACSGGLTHISVKARRLALRYALAEVLLRADSDKRLPSL